MRIHPLLVASLFAFPFAVACADPPERVDGDPVEGPDGLPIGNHGENPGGDGDGDTQTGDGDGDTQTGDGDGDGDTTSYALTFVGTAPVVLVPTETRELVFQVVDADGVAVGAAHITVTASAGQLESANLITDSTGRARVDYTAAGTAGAATLSAQTEHASPLSVAVQVVAPPVGDVELVVTSHTRIAVAETDVFAWVGAPAAVPTCAELAELDPLPPADFYDELAALPGSRVLSELATGERVTAVAVGLASSGTLIATACRENITVVGGTVTTAALTLEQDDSVLDGDYDTLLHLSLGTALPEPYESYVTTTTNVLSDPAGFATYWALREVDDQLGTSFIEWENAAVPPYASYEEVAAHPEIFGTWSTARALLDSQLSAQLGQPYDDVTTVGGDLHELVTDFDVGARYEITQTAAGQLEITERWQALVFEWSLGCDAGDLGCARHAVEIDDVSLSATDVTFGAVYDLEPPLAPGAETERFRVRANAHSMSLRYGAVITAAFNQVVFPSLPGGLAGDDLNEVLHNLVDCTDVGAAIHDAIGFGGDALYAGLCDAGLNYAAGQITDQVVSLELGDDTPTLAAKDHEGAFGGGELILVDADHDLATELLRDFTWEVKWNDPENPALSDEILLPITGEGRLAASRCEADADCGAGASCQPVPHYLKVTAAETDCKEKVGALFGEQTCSVDADCATGLCLTGEGGDRFCFEACVSGDTCASGTCGPASVLDQDGLMVGLGPAVAQACGFAPAALEEDGICENTCTWANDGVCDDGGPGSEYSVCGLGTDCGDCGAR